MLNRFFQGLIFSFLVSLSLHAHEGMWLFNQLPLDLLEKQYGFRPTPEWIENTMRASVRLNSGGSGSFISPEGLVLTNHHVAEPSLHQLSTQEKDLLTHGFLAATREEELQVPGAEFNVLDSIEDVTERVEAATKGIEDLEESQKARRAVIAEIERESFEKTGFRSDVVTLYQGGQYHLYRYKKYTDIRMVFAPEKAAGFFGGDPDNFEFPRYDLDMAIFRIYENGAPLKTKNYLPWSVTGVKEGDLVFVSGNPGRTDRLFTTEALEFERDTALPFQLEVLRRKERSLISFGGLGKEHSRRAANELFSVQNQLKRLSARLLALQEPFVFEKKLAEETKLKKSLLAQSKNSTLDAWDDIAAARAEYAPFYRRLQLLESGLGLGSKLLDMARTIVRIADEDLKADGDRLEEYRTASRDSLLLKLYSKAPIYQNLEENKLVTSLGLLVDELGWNDPMVRLVLNGKGVRQRAHELVTGSRLFDVEYRKKLVQKASASKSTDPFIKLAIAIDTEARTLREKFEVRVQEPERRAYAQIAQALFAIYSKDQYPDATFTPRLAFGLVNSFEQRSEIVQPFTTIGGAFEHEKAHDAKEPWVLPQSWHKAKADLDLDTPLNFVSSADTIGGNSGSPVINIKGELVGLNFDGNEAKIPNNYYFDERTMRHVAVDCRGMLHALQKIYKANHLVKELTP